MVIGSSGRSPFGISPGGRPSTQTQDASAFPRAGLRLRSVCGAVWRAFVGGPSLLPSLPSEAAVPLHKLCNSKESSSASGTGPAPPFAVLKLCENSPRPTGPFPARARDALATFLLHARRHRCAGAVGAGAHCGPRDVATGAIHIVLMSQPPQQASAAMSPVFLQGGRRH
ncbi:hypothetical protein AAFF_G00304950 [Aldrovandia affinis]|uniref:Uncharacterized protein n=1 Tax=Aldrovandia affinis TaxID=143900 RepID=A0AAD7SPB9_9TELE|nr:hypothetical protein AAFF_G00304950 [Aldrovandia affinis]